MVSNHRFNATHKTQGCHRVVNELSLDCHLLTTLRLSGLYLRLCLLVVKDDNPDNFWDDNHKVVTVTIRLTTLGQLCVLCVEGSLQTLTTYFSDHTESYSRYLIT